MRKNKQKQRKFLALAALVAAAGLLVYLILVNAVFLVRDVRVEGNSEIAAEDIIRAAKLPMGRKMSAVDVERAKIELESGGQVELLEVRKRYPSEIVLIVRERSRDAVAMHAGYVLSLERDGTVVEQSREMPDTDAVYVTGLTITSYRLGTTLGAPSEQLKAMRAVLEAIAENGARAYVSELNVESANSIFIYSRTGMRVELGDSENMDKKIIWMAGALADLESRGETGGRLDVSSGSKADYSPN